MHVNACYRELGIGEAPQEVVTVVKQLTGGKDVKEDQYGVRRLSVYVPIVCSFFMAFMFYINLADILLPVDVI